jgi:hypothetical protein
MPEIGRPPPPDGYPEEVENAMTRWGEAHGEQLFMGKRAPPKKDTAAQDKAAQSLYLVETRARYGEIIVSHPVILHSNFRYEWIFNCTEWMAQTTSSTSVI